MTRAIEQLVREDRFGENNCVKTDLYWHLDKQQSQSLQKVTFGEDRREVLRIESNLLK